MRAQQQGLAMRVLAFDVEGVVHRPRRVVLGLVERGEVIPIGLDLRPVGHIEADRAEDRLDPLPGAADRMDAARLAHATRQRDIDSLLGEARVELRRGDRGAAIGEQSLDPILRVVDAAAAVALDLGWKLAEPLQELGDDALLAEEARLRVLERRQLVGRGELRSRFGDDRVEVLHGRPEPISARLRATARASARRFGSLESASGGRELRLRRLGELRERLLVRDRDIGEHLAVDLDRGLLQAAHECAVAEAALACRGVDPRDPQGAKLALAHPAVAVRVLPRLHHRLLGDAKDVLPAAAISLRLVEDLLMLRARRDAAFDAWHGLVLLTRRGASCARSARWPGRRRWCRAGGACAWSTSS